MKKTVRSRKTSQRDDDAIQQVIMRSPTSSCREIRFNLLKNGTDISISTISRRLSKQFGLKSYKPAAKRRPPSAIKKKRLSFAKKHIHCTVKKWETVLFSDKSTV